MRATPAEGIPIEVHLGPLDSAVALRRDAAAGLTATPKELPPTWLYDDRGCDLFEAITRLPEHYLTRTEWSILAERADEAAALSGADTLIELGAGTSEKTRLLLDALDATGQLRRFVPLDVSEPILTATVGAVADEHPQGGVVGDFRRHLATLPTGWRRLIAFLGGTIGNLRPHERAAMLIDVAGTMAAGDSLLLGTDLVKDRSRLLAAYDDAVGVTEAFDKNVLAMLNRELDADMDVDRLDHVAVFDETEEWIEMRLRSRTRQNVRIEALDLTIAFAEGEDLRTEISAKFHPAGVRAELEAAGLRAAALWTDPVGDYAATLAVR